MSADVTIKVAADTSQADASLKNTEQTLHAIQTSDQPTSGGALPNGGRTASVGRQLGIAAVGFVANEGFQTLSHIVGNQEGGSRTARRMSNVGGGAIAGASAGFMVGGPIGAAIGAIAGAGLGIAKELSDSAKAVRESRQALNAEYRAVGQGYAVGFQDRAFSHLLETRSIEEQKSLVSKRIEQLKSGNGENSLVNLRAHREALENEEQTDTEEYRIIKEKMGIQMGRLSQLLRTQEELSLTPTAGILGAESVTDALGAMGGTVGATVEVADINQRQLDVLERIYEVLHSAGREDVSDASALAGRTQAVFG